MASRRGVRACACRAAAVLSGFECLPCGPWCIVWDPCPPQVRRTIFVGNLDKRLGEEAIRARMSRQSPAVSRGRWLTALWGAGTALWTTWTSRPPMQSTVHAMWVSMLGRLKEHGGLQNPEGSTTHTGPLRVPLASGQTQLQLRLRSLPWRPRGPAAAPCRPSPVLHVYAA